jgi:hypothetical protein
MSSDLSQAHLFLPLPCLAREAIDFALLGPAPRKVGQPDSGRVGS